MTGRADGREAASRDQGSRLGRFVSESRELGLMTVVHRREWPGRYPGAVKVVDIFGNDTMTLVPVNVG